ncbi:MAG: peptidoglycan DD-metalloendopeptidase family protein, partial [Nannocystaceae bacterium]|nr:peptidoglycan DD-metalloendopeptidase family protein [Nannocystaceae bacterium]
GGRSTGEILGCPRVRVDVGAGLTLNVRPDPSTVNAPVGSLANGAVVDVLGEVLGESIDGVELWYEIENPAVQGYVLSSLVECTTQEPPELDGFYLPLPCGTTAQVTQGNNGALSHNGLSAYAFDFGRPLGSPLVAIAGGVVSHVFDETGPGDACYSGGGMECSAFANYVTLLHADGSQSLYMHLQTVSVGVGDAVSIGTQVGLSGSTGWSTGRHAHIMRMEDCGGYYCQSLPLAFSDVAGGGVPITGDAVTSGNCP